MSFRKQWFYIVAVIGLVMTATCPGWTAEKGWVKVFITPPAAVEAGAAWSVDQGRTLIQSGREIELPPGQYEIHFKLLSGWQHPPAHRFTLRAGEATEVRGSYVRIIPEAKLSVNIGPVEAAEAGAAWSVDGGRTWRAGGEETALEPGEYRIIFKLLSGWQSPPSQDMNLTPGTAAEVQAKYARLFEEGRLIVELGPAEAAEAGAAWSVDSGRTWRRGGEAVELKPGAYAVVFKSISGWREPPTHHFNLSARAALRIEGLYARLAEKGRLEVDLGPAEAAEAGAAWSVDGGRTWRAGGEAVALEPGPHVVTFKSAPGWSRPEPMTVQVLRGGATQVSGHYGSVTVGSFGWLEVDIAPPEAVEAGAAWSVDAGTTWFESGQRVRLDPDAYRVRFKAAAGWRAPEDVVIKVNRHKVSRVSGTYARP